MDALGNMSSVLTPANDMTLGMTSSHTPIIRDHHLKTMTNVTSELRDFNDDKAFILIPVIVYSAACMIVGITGSALVCFICGFKLRKNVTNIFVLALASIDLISCVLCIPLEIMELRLPYMFDFPLLCKFLRSLRSLTTITSGLILVAIAIERYNRICKPLNKHINTSQAKRTCVAVIIIGVICSWPAVFVFGNKITILQNSIQGVECSVDDSLNETFYPFAFYVFLFLLYFATSMSLCVLYSLIAAKIWQRRKLLTNLRNRSPSIPESVICDRETKSCSSGETSHARFVENVARNIQKGNLPRPSIVPATTNTKRKQIYSRKRTTCIMFCMTLTFIVSCLPYIIVSICRSIMRNMDNDLTASGEVFFQLAMKSYMISSAINPYIYGFSNRQFKEECLKLLTAVYCKPSSKAKHAITSQSAKGILRTKTGATGESEA